MPKPGERVRARLLVKGLVQGVYFRANMKRVAEEAGVKGYVRNLPDGESVEAVLEGEYTAVEKVICWSLRGPPLARVRELHLEFTEYRGEFDSFEIQY